MRKFYLTALFLLAVITLTACASTQRAPDRPVTTVEVQNQNFLDMNVYVVTYSQRQRLGTVTGLTTQTLTIPRNIIFGNAELSFEMHPIGSRAQPRSQTITVAEGDHIVLVIPNF